MIEVNNIYVEDCMETMQRMISEDFIVDYIITSPPYNTVNNGKALMSESARKIFVGRYDIFQENMTNEEYLEWTRQLFNNFDKILKKNGCIQYVLGYGNGNPTLMYDILHTIIQTMMSMGINRIVSFDGGFKKIGKYDVISAI